MFYSVSCVSAIKYLRLNRK